MGALKASKNQARLAGETKDAQEKRKKKGKENKNTYFNPKEKNNPSKGAFGFNKDKQKKIDNAKCSYYKRENHL